MSIVTKQQLIDAAADVDTIEQVVNGAVSPGTLTSRLGTSLRTILKVIKDLEDEINTAGDGWLALAEEWASKVNGIVDTTDFSAKAWAVGGTGVTDTASKGAAKEWAIETASTVDTSEYSAKEYAVGTQRRGLANGGSAKDWASYTGGTVDNTLYSAKKYAEDSEDFYNLITSVPESSPVTTYATSYSRTIKDRFSNAINLMDFIPSAERAAIEAGTSTYDVATALSNAYTEAGTAKKWRIYAPAGLWTFYDTYLTLNGNIHIFGDAEGTEFRKHSTATNNYIFKSASSGTVSNVEIDNILVTNQRVTASGTQGAINFDGADFTNISIHDMIYNSSTAYCNFIFFKAASGKTISNIESEKNNILNCLRMGMEVINHDNTTNFNIVGVSSHKDRFVNCGLMGISISGPIKSVDITSPYLKDCGTNGIELVGPSACKVRGATFSGTMTQLISGALGSSLSQGTGIIISDCVTEGTVTGRVELVNVGDISVHDNNFNTTGIFSLHDARTFRANVHDNILTTTASNVLICDNTPNNRIHHNYLDNSASGSVTAVLRGNNTGAINNIFTDNVLVKGTGGTHIDYASSAVKFVQERNIQTGIPDSNVTPYQKFSGSATVATGASTTSTCVITFDVSSSWRPFNVTAKATCTTTGGSGASQGGAESKIHGRVINSTTAVQISKTDVIVDANIVLTTSYGTNSMTITATVTAGVQVGWNIDGFHHIGVAKPSIVFA